ncbi:hypothetical protein [Streptomonospora litoralis]|uniref:Uncharacterized protein n=1 Tax=Streptomonospora litoralis TaxID=2498135 RepID=A0A4P6PYT7_9ACTN|nr:hypothetical protein [Streptomonospora litoralis]QBI53466.1 hypothetical protein EKD16_08360 [Streptomonospora litoralis]
MTRPLWRVALIASITVAYGAYVLSAVRAVNERDGGELGFVLLSAALATWIWFHRCRPATARMRLRIGCGRIDCLNCGHPDTFVHRVDTVDSDGYTVLTAHTHCIACGYCNLTDHTEQETPS